MTPKKTEDEKRRKIKNKAKKTVLVKQQHRSYQTNFQGNLTKSGNNFSTPKDHSVALTTPFTCTASIPCPSTKT
jgi:DNA-directed RNA polymerase beta subunit